MDIHPRQCGLDKTPIGFWQILDLSPVVNLMNQAGRPVSRPAPKQKAKARICTGSTCSRGLSWTAGYIQWISVVRFFLLDLSKWETWNLWRKRNKNKLYLFDRMPKSALLAPKWSLPQVYQCPSLILVCLPSPKLNVSGWHRRLPQSYVDQISPPNPSQNVAQINMLMPD